ncbi:hypothetical protein K461DRAFT_286629 [Myriangium duriaei CBS 260.36]|uniref:AB hydrolase-1 domain-containing protein n=1 Tax=Myriangium duriaei CBS 260.36 TaxID=1168546 RepID=A0A9P4MFZ7_9PEZI|nr:hypothetical protein K461DRAFT_286629 [Myriangium duriaei CBS 260.36]
MSRLRKANASSRIGNLFINYGGPGAASTEIILGYALNIGKETYISQDLLDHFDIIGVDPRGIGTSTPLQCDLDIFNERVSYAPKTEADFAKLVAHNKAVGESCLKLSGNLTRHMDTVSVARDFEAVRIAAGGEKMNFLALSYGTLIAQQYAQLFPESVRALALDGIVDHDQPPTSTIVTESQTYEAVLDKFITWCESNSTCALHGQDVGAVIDSVLAAADQEPLPVPNAAQQRLRANVTGEEMRFNIQGMLLAQEFTWASLGQALADAKNGSGAALATPLAQQNVSSSLTPLWSYAVGCLDWRHQSRSVYELQYFLGAASNFSPRTQGISQSWSYASGCIGWPVPIQNPPHPAGVHGTPPILMVNALFDPSCSYVWATGVKYQIENSILVARNGTGHISYFLAGEASNLITSYLVNGTLPAPGTIVDS